MTLITGTNLNETIAPNQAPDNNIGTGRDNTPITTDEPAPNDSFLNGVPLPEEIFTGDDTLIGLGGDDLLEAGNGDDRLEGGDGVDELVGGEGNDTLIGGASNGLGVTDSNFLEGQDGNDWVSYADVTDDLTVNLNDADTFISLANASIAFPDIEVTIPDEQGTTGLEFGEAFDDTSSVGLGFGQATHGSNRDLLDLIQTIENVEGAANRQNQLAGNEDDNIIVGGSLEDTLFGGSEGADTLQGQAGNDSYVIDPSLSGETADVGGTVIEDTGGNDRLGFFEAPTAPIIPEVPTGDTIDTINMARFGTDLILDLNQDGTANAEDDLTIKNFYNSSGGAGTGFIEQIADVTGQNILDANLPDFGGSEISWTTPIQSETDPGPTDPILDGDGNPLENIVFSDSVSGITSYIYDNFGEDPINLDELSGVARGIYTQLLNGHDNGIGTSESDNINGNRGDDTIRGGAGEDGDRTVDFPADQVRTALRGGRGGDQVFGEADNDILNGNLDGDIVDGGEDDDIIRGGQNDDILIGGEGSDFLFGDKGKDLLIGGTLAEDGTINPDGAQDIFEVKDEQLEEADLIRGFEDGTDLMLLPQGITFDELTINPIQLSVDGAIALQSSQILLDEQTLILVEGIIPSNLDANDFTSLSETVDAGGSLTNEQISFLG